MTLPINYADGDTIHGADVDSWTSVINALAELAVPAGYSLTSGYATTVTSATAVTLAYASPGVQAFTGSAAQTVALPTTSVTSGMTWIIANFSSATVTVQASGGATVATVAAGAVSMFAATTSTPTTAAGWTTTPQQTLVNPLIDGYTEGTQALGTVTTSKTIAALTNGTLVTATLTNGDTCAFTLPTPVQGLSFLLFVQQPASTGSGAYSFTSPSGSVLWSSAGAPTMTAGANKADLIAFVCADGANWYGTATQGFTV